jgi:hypothetical protein
MAGQPETDGLLTQVAAGVPAPASSSDPAAPNPAHQQGAGSGPSVDGLIAVDTAAQSTVIRGRNDFFFSARSATVSVFAGHSSSVCTHLCGFNWPDCGLAAGALYADDMLSCNPLRHSLSIRIVVQHRPQSLPPEPSPGARIQTNVVAPTGQATASEQVLLFRYLATVLL